MGIPPELHDTDLVSTKIAAHLLGVSEKTLERWREKKWGPQWIRQGFGRTTPYSYRILELRQWLASRSFASHADENAANSAIAKNQK